jgi:hypothetical protein
MHGNFATMETDLSFGPAPAVADAASAASIQRMRVSNAIVCDFRKRISSIRRSSLSSINRQSASRAFALALERGSESCGQFSNSS